MIVIRIESLKESIGYGALQHCIRDKYLSARGDNGGNRWCTANSGSETNYYPGYRDWRAFYYVLNKNVPEDHDYRIFAIGAVRPGASGEPFTLTNAKNTVNANSLDFDTIVAKTGCQQLLNVEDKIKWFPETVKETIERKLDRYTFDDPTSPTDFLRLENNRKLQYIDHLRKIKTGRALKGCNEQLQKTYCALTTAENFKNRFITESYSEDPFIMLKVLHPRNVKFLDSEVLKRQQGIPDGIRAIKAIILSKYIKASYRDHTNPDIWLCQNKQMNNIFGLFDIKNLDWAKPLKYTKKEAIIRINKYTKEKFVFMKYVSDNDYFYFIANADDLYKRTIKNETGKDIPNPNYNKGRYYEGVDGDEILSKFNEK